MNARYMLPQAFSQDCFLSSRWNATTNTTSWSIYTATWSDYSAPYKQLALHGASTSKVTYHWPSQNLYFPGICTSFGASMTKKEELVRLSQSGASLKSNKAPLHARKQCSTESYSNSVTVLLWPAILFNSRSLIFGWQFPWVTEHFSMLASNLLTMWK